MIAGGMPPPQFLLLDDSYSDIQDLTNLIKRIGIANKVKVFGRLADAQQFLEEADVPRRPVLVFVASRPRGGRGIELVRWMRGRPELAAVLAIVLPDAEDETDQRDLAALGIPAVAKPLDMHPLIAALKALGLAEKVRINGMTMSVEVELWPK
jgi:DNA-binding response OmpR family regulator